jgi:hypothetical protein
MSAPMPNAAMRGPWGIPESLSDLHGPTEGTVQLPLHLCWSGEPEFDVGQLTSRLLMYQILITEADRADLENYMTAAHLLSVWPRLRRLLGSRYRDPWEERFPELVQAAEEAEPALSEELHRVREAIRGGYSF